MQTGSKGNTLSNPLFILFSTFPKHLGSIERRPTHHSKLPKFLKFTNISRHYFWSS